MSEIIQICLKKTKSSTFQAIRYVLFFRAYKCTCSNDYLTPVGRCPNSNCLECLAHGRLCFRGFMQEQARCGRIATIFVLGVLFAQLFGRIRIHYLAYYSDQTEYEQIIRYSLNQDHTHIHTSSIQPSAIMGQHLWYKMSAWQKLETE